MKLLLPALFALALWAPLGWAARKKPESPSKGLSSSSSPALDGPAHPGKRRKQQAASELILGQGVAEETLKSVAGVESVAGEKGLRQKGEKPSILKNSVLRRKEAALPNYLNGQNLGQGGVPKKLSKFGKKVLGTKRAEAASSSVGARPESAAPATNLSLAQAGSMYPQKGLIHVEKTPVREPVTPQKAKARKEYAVTSRNSTRTQIGKVPGPWHGNESQALSSPTHKNTGKAKEGKEPRIIQSNASRALLQKENISPHRNTSKPASRKDQGPLLRNASHTPMRKEYSALTRNGTQAQGVNEPRLVPKKASKAQSEKEHGIPSANTSWSLTQQKQGISQRNASQAQMNKRLRVAHNNASQALSGKRLITPNRNTSWVEVRKEPTLTHKNASQAAPQEKPRFSHRNASQALPGKQDGSQQRNITWAEVNKEHRPPHQNASWALPRKDSSSSRRNVSRSLAGAEHGILRRKGGQARARNLPGVPFRNVTQTEAVKEQNVSHRNVFRAGGTPKWQPAVPKERDEPIMPSLPVTCLLSEHAIACGNARLKHVPRLSDTALRTLYLAENEITHVPAGIFLGLPNLEWLDLSKNKLDSAGLHPEAFKNLTKLKRLNLDGNRLTAVPALPSSLQELKMNDNNLEGLQRHNFRGLFKLLTLELEANELHDGNVLPTTFKPLSRLIYLRLDRNRFRAIPPGLPASLQELHLDSNRIEEVTESVLNKTLNLTVLVLSNNKLQEDRIAPRAWINLPKLEALDLSHNRLVHVPSFLPRHLKQLTLHHNRIERIPGYVFAHMKPGLEFLHLSHNALRDDGIHAVSFLGLYRSLAELLLDNNQLQAIPRGILNLKGLQVLRLSHNRIRHVPLNSVCDTRVAEDSNIVSMHLENNLIDRRRIPPTAFSCIKAYHSVVLRPQQNEEDDY
uniref:extracellular matrix protein 2-like n=1 Tax=Podarcis muralis TaxID=64176 RepID=UPI0010A043BF|nr:extracellular matrix protein 2-like [Podarcis muralis]